MTDRKNLNKVRPLLIEKKLNRWRRGVCICSAEGKVLHINSQGLTILGIDHDVPDPEQLIGREIISFVDAFQLLFDAVRDEGEIIDRRLQISLPAGDTRWISYCASLSDEVTGAPDSVVVIFFDVTEAVNHVKELYKADRHLNSIIETIPDIIYRVDPDGNITFVSEEVSVYGYNPDDLIGKNILDIVHPDDRDSALTHLRERRTGPRKTRSYEVRFLTKKQVPVRFELTERVVHQTGTFAVSAEGIYLQGDDDVKVFIGSQGVAQDISDRKIAESALQHHEEKWKTILESLEDGYYEVDLKGNFLYVNNALCKIMKYSSKDVIGQSYRKFFSGSASSNLFSMFNNVYKTGNSTQLSGWVAVTGDGHKIDIEGSISVIKDSAGEVSGFRGIIRDITKRKKINSELIHARKLEAIGILAGGIAHDYNNALTAILGNISLAKMEIGAENKGLMEILNDAETASLKVMELTKRLSSFAMGGKPDRKVCDLVALVREAAYSVFVDTDIQYTINADEGLWEVEIDDFQVSQVFGNIFINAHEALTAGGSVEITIQNVVVTREESHHEIMLQPDNYVRVTIRDNGPGIAEGDLPRIFDPYFTTKEFASGMGLATGYAIIKRHYGYIDVKSVPGECTSFFVYFPVTDAVGVNNS